MWVFTLYNPVDITGLKTTHTTCKNNIWLNKISRWYIFLIFK